MPLGRREFLESAAAIAGGALLSTATMTAAAAAGDENASLGKTPHTRFAVNVEM